MKVKQVYFLKCIPGLPIYELMDGTIMLPFLSKDKGTWFYYSEKEVTNKVSDTKILAAQKRPFHLAKAEINATKLRIFSKTDTAN
jgi:hypothetical protein